ncbi:HIT domain-containing protein [Lactobacillus sp. S2-2]|uniref:HIT family protein n=1 Tax=Lactobacillus sp. S2-2 TaxID=2692917 RepID=UPI001F174677|nr:HIT family protein [Lactobacillus sp. S2-2]MCF6515164.1 HIT domain-containing protein [Lactobacillus sp. S2-2]
MNDNCIFCKIINGEIPSYKVYEDEKVLAFLDISQTTPGHTLVVPKKHIKNIFSATDSDAADIFSRIPKIAKAIKNSNSDIQGMNILNNNEEIAYQSVFHMHIHLVPRYTNKDKFKIEFSDNSKQFDEEKLASLAESIRKEL